MMARSKCSNQRPDTLLQDRSPPARRNHLQRTAGPYIRVKSVGPALSRALPVHPGERTYSVSAATSQKGTSTDSCTAANNSIIRSPVGTVLELLRHVEA